MELHPEQAQVLGTHPGWRTKKPLQALRCRHQLPGARLLPHLLAGSVCTGTADSCYTTATITWARTKHSKPCSTARCLLRISIARAASSGSCCHLLTPSSSTLGAQRSAVRRSGSGLLRLSRSCGSGNSLVTRSWDARVCSLNLVLLRVTSRCTWSGLITDVARSSGLSRAI